MKMNKFCYFPFTFDTHTFHIYHTAFVPASVIKIFAQLRDSERDGDIAIGV